MAFRFEELEIWKDAVKFCGRIYEVTETFPKEETFGLASQVRRAATSISLNIAEGSGRSIRREFARFLDVATGSVFEAVAAVAIARQRGFVSKDYYTEIYSSAEDLAKKIARLRKTLLARGSG